MKDKDYLRATNDYYKAGYEHGRRSVIIELSIIIFVSSLLIFLFN